MTYWQQFVVLEAVVVPKCYNYEFAGGAFYAWSRVQVRHGYCCSVGIQLLAALVVIVTVLTI